ncbi:unnamed protein product [Pleuronectes platessa]|uniref:Uncharacterized protein n=1 Tax=Pleuronectes platessa TaxID=8262 RepID=A0A9N7VWJ0_PLEPL|nr:unnamed protein product [Pleuronectes platessa]
MLGTRKGRNKTRTGSVQCSSSQTTSMMLKSGHFSLSLPRDEAMSDPQDNRHRSSGATVRDTEKEADPEGGSGGTEDGQHLAPTSPIPGGRSIAVGPSRAHKHDS